MRVIETQKSPCDRNHADLALQVVRQVGLEQLRADIGYQISSTCIPEAPTARMESLYEIEGRKYQPAASG